MIAVSIIVPVYNVEKYLKKCLDSILNQTLGNIEIIIINDGSEDNSQKIIDEYKKNEKIVSVIEENGGLSSARNRGIKLATGEYLLFIDSDDYIENTMAADMYKKAKDENLDIVVTKFKFIDEKTKKQKNQSGKFPRQNLSSNELLSELLLGNISFHVCNKMFKKSLFIDNDIYFPVGQLYEDQTTLLKLVINSREIGCLDNTYYHYLLREQSITKQTSLKAIKDHLIIIEDIEKIIKKFHIDLSIQYKNFLITQYYYNLKLIESSNLESSILEIVESMDQETQSIKVTNQKISFKNKLKLIILKKKIRRILNRNGNNTYNI